MTHVWHFPDDAVEARSLADFAVFSHVTIGVRGCTKRKLSLVLLGWQTESLRKMVNDSRVAISRRPVETGFASGSCRVFTCYHRCPRLHEPEIEPRLAWLADRILKEDGK
jgi:hypothetical protein